MEIRIIYTKINYDTDYEIHIEKITNYILKGDYNSINNIRNIIFNISITNINHNKILQDIIKNILKSKLSDIIKIKIMKLVSNLEHNLIRGRRSIIHFDSIIIGIMNIIYTNKKIVIKKKYTNNKNNILIK